jgi:hypothetical protein
MEKGKEKRGVLERGAAFFEKLHYGLGAAAVGGALLLPEFSAPLLVFGAWEVAHGALWNWLKNRAAKRPKLAPA